MWKYAAQLDPRFGMSMGRQFPHLALPMDVRIDRLIGYGKRLCKNGENLDQTGTSCYVYSRRFAMMRGNKVNRLVNVGWHPSKD